MSVLAPRDELERVELSAPIEEMLYRLRVLRLEIQLACETSPELATSSLVTELLRTLQAEEVTWNDTSAT